MSNWTALKAQALQRGYEDLAAFCEAMNQQNCAMENDDYDAAARYHDVADKALEAWGNSLKREKTDPNNKPKGIN